MKYICNDLLVLMSNENKVMFPIIKIAFFQNVCFESEATDCIDYITYTCTTFYLLKSSLYPDLLFYWIYICVCVCVCVCMYACTSVIAHLCQRNGVTV